jgi:DNA-binding IclR family transcriptional regulator
MSLIRQARDQLCNLLTTARATRSPREVLLVGIELAERNVATVSQISSNTRIPTTTTWEVVYRLLERQFVEVAEVSQDVAGRKGARSDAEWFRLTEAGRRHMRQIASDTNSEVGLLVRRFRAADRSSA